MMDERKRLKEALRRNLVWFENSGVMDPPNGSWGVAERVLLTEGNEAKEKTFSAFTAYSEYERHAIIEHRRPDCNFETALMFRLAAEAFDDSKHMGTANNILRYLYDRSGLLNRKRDAFPYGAWKWSSEQWPTNVYFDDNAWNATIAIILGSRYPELESRFELVQSGLDVCEVMLEAFDNQFKNDPPEGAFRWAGDIHSPHWGSLSCMAFAYAHQRAPSAKYLKAIEAYDRHVNDAFDSFTTSEHAYVVIGSGLAASLLGHEASGATARRSADVLLKKQDPETGNIPSEWSKEAPSGEHLVDLIYTQNWALLGLFLMSDLDDSEQYHRAFHKAFDLVLSVQDPTPEAHLHGCWRGMYDLKTAAWGGGNRYEGGADSIYTGWTNAPISIIICAELLGKNPLTL